MKIIADSHIPFLQEYFGAYGELILVPGRHIHHDTVKDADILLVRSVTHVDEKLLKNSSIKFVGSVTAGADHLETKWLDAAGIPWSVAHGFNAPPVADYVVSVIAALERKRLLIGKHRKAAVIGVGNVGRLVVEKLKLMGFEVFLCDPYRALNEKEFASVSLSELTDMDLISLHVPLTKTGDHPTYHFIDKAFLARQKPGSILLNASRGAVIDSRSLLQYGEHLHWCFDVWEHEPTIYKEILKKAFIATPHIAGYSVQSKSRGIDMIYRIACEKNIIEPQPLVPLRMKRQQLAFAGENHHWQDVILGVFNPLVMTAIMRTVLLPAEKHGHLFDDLRNHFNYRFEFEFTTVINTDIFPQDTTTLKQLGLRLQEG